MAGKKYFAFISYSHKDSELAKWLQHEFEYYELPAKLFEERKDLCKKDLPESFRPIFRDEDELAGGELKPQISEALADSEYLIVVCSPNSAQSVYVDSEIREFISLSQENKRRIFPFIVGGKPHSKDNSIECFPKILLELSEDKTDPIELIGGDIDIHTTGRDHAFVKILAGTLREKNVRFADLWDRYAIEKAEKERKEREDKEKLQIAQSRFVAEKANNLSSFDSYLARRLSVEVLPEDIDPPNRPYVPEADAALRRSSYKNNTILRGHTESVESAGYSPDGKRILSTSKNMIKIWDVETGINIYSIEKTFTDAVFYRDNLHIITISGYFLGSKVEIQNLETGEIRSFDMPHDFWAFKCTFSHSRNYVATDMHSLWDITKGELVKELPCGEYTEFGEKFCFSPDDTLIAYCFKHQVWISNLSAQDHKVLPEGHVDKVSSVDFHSSGKKLVSASWDKTLKIWDVETASVLKTLTGHTERVFSVAYSLDGKRIASGDEGGAIIIWDSETGEVVKRFYGHTKSISSIQFSPNGKYIVSSSADKTVRLWDLEDHAELRQYNNVHTFNTLFDPIAVNSVDKTIAYAFDNCLVLRDVETRSISLSLYAMEGNINSIAFSPDGKSVIATSGKTLLLWDLGTGKVIRKFMGHHNEILSVSISADGKRVASTSIDKTLKIWDVNSGECVVTKEVKAWMVVYSPDGHHLAYNTRGEIIICDSNTYEDMRHISTDKSEIIFSFCFSPLGDTIVSLSGGNIYQWDVETGLCLNRYIDSTNAQASNLSGPITYSSDGKNILFVSGDNTRTILDSDSLTLVTRFNDGSKEQKKFFIDGSEESSHRCRISCAVFSYDGKSIVTSSSERIIITDLSTKKVLDIIEKPSLKKIEKIAFHSNKELLAVVYNGMNNLVMVRDYPMGQIVQMLIGHAKSINSVVFNQNGNRIVTTSDDGTVRIWDVDSGSEIKCLESYCEMFEYATFSSNGTGIVAISKYNLRVFFRNLNESPYIHRGSGMLEIDGNIVKVKRKGKKLELIGHTGCVNSVILSPDGNNVISASCDNEIKVWNVSDGELMQTLKGHHGSVNYAAYSSDGQYIISASDDSTVKLWNAQNGLLLKTFSCSNRQMFTVDISIDNRKIVAASTDNTIILWDIQDDRRMKIFNQCFENRIVKIYFSIDGKYIGVSEGLGFRIIDITNGETSLLPVVRMWNYVTDTITLNNHSHSEAVNSVRFSADGRKVITASDDAIIRVLDPVTCQLKKMLKLDKQVGVKFVCFDRYGKNVISIDYDKRLTIWRLDTGMMVSCFDNISDLYCISPDGKYISYVAEDRRVVICDIETNTVIQSINNTQYGYDSMTFSSDGDTIILTENSSIFIWDFPPLQQLINDTRERFKDNPLTEEERRQYYLD